MNPNSKQILHTIGTYISEFVSAFISLVFGAMLGITFSAMALKIPPEKIINIAGEESYIGLLMSIIVISALWALLCTLGDWIGERTFHRHPIAQ